MNLKCRAAHLTVSSPKKELEIEPLNLSDWFPDPYTANVSAHKYEKVTPIPIPQISDFEIEMDERRSRREKLKRDRQDFVKTCSSAQLEKMKKLAVDELNLRPAQRKVIEERVKQRVARCLELCELEPSLHNDGEKIRKARIELKRLSELRSFYTYMHELARLSYKNKYGINTPFFESKLKDKLSYSFLEDMMIINEPIEGYTPSKKELREREWIQEATKHKANVELEAIYVCMSNSYSFNTRGFDARAKKAILEIEPQNLAKIPHVLTSRYERLGGLVGHASAFLSLSGITGVAAYLFYNTPSVQKRESKTELSLVGGILGSLSLITAGFGWSTIREHRRMVYEEDLREEARIEDEKEQERLPEPQEIIVPALPGLAAPLIPNSGCNLSDSVGLVASSLLAQTLAVEGAKMLKKYPNSKVNKKVDETLNKAVSVPEKLRVYEVEENQADTFKDLKVDDKRINEKIAQRVLKNPFILHKLEQKGFTSRFRKDILQRLKQGQGLATIKEEYDLEAIDEDWDPAAKVEDNNTPSPSKEKEKEKKQETKSDEPKEINQKEAAPPHPKSNDNSGDVATPPLPNNNNNKMPPLLTKRQQLAMLLDIVEQIKLYISLTPVQQIVVDFEISLRKFCQMIDPNHPAIRWVASILGMLVYYMSIIRPRNARVEKELKAKKERLGFEAYSSQDEADDYLKYLMIFLFFLLIFIMFGYFSGGRNYKKRKNE